MGGATEGLLLLAPPNISWWQTGREDGTKEMAKLPHSSPRAETGSPQEPGSCRQEEKGVRLHRVPSPKATAPVNGLPVPCPSWRNPLQPELLQVEKHVGALEYCSEA